MFEFITKLFDTSDFPSRWHCGTWSAAHGWTHIGSDVAIFGAYIAIPCLLVYFVLRRRDVPFLPIFWLFGAFILSCGFGHLIEATIFWQPWYRFSAAIKLCTALVSWATVAALIPILPRALSLPGLAAANKQLETEIAERKAAERTLQQQTHDLKQSYDEMENFTRNVVDREQRVIELKHEVNQLLKELGRDLRYTTELV